MYPRRSRAISRSEGNHLRRESVVSKLQCLSPGLSFSLAYTCFAYCPETRQREIFLPLASFLVGCFLNTAFHLGVFVCALSYGCRWTRFLFLATWKVIEERVVEFDDGKQCNGLVFLVAFNSLVISIRRLKRRRTGIS